MRMCSNKNFNKMLKNNKLRRVSIKSRYYIFIFLKDDTKYLSAIHLTEAIICENALNYERIKEISKIKEKKLSLEESLSFIN